MSSVPTPQLPQYRITLFYGPEAVAGSVERIHCVFNVKKRSWKAGTQVVVELDDAQLAKAEKAIELEAWTKTSLVSLPEVEWREAEARVPDLFAQAVCAVKLDLAIEHGIPQENLTIGADRFGPELEHAIFDQRSRIIEYLRTELDLPGN